MTTLKLKINVNLPQLSCIVISAAQLKMTTLSGFVSFALIVTTRYITNAKLTKSLKFAILTPKK